VKAAKVPFTNAFLPKILAENLKERKLETDQGSSFARKLIVPRILLNVIRSPRVLCRSRKSVVSHPEKEQFSFGRVAQLVNRMTRKERSEESAGSSAGRWQERERDVLRDGCDAGSGTGEGLGPTGGKEEDGIRGEDAARRESDAAEEKEKRCVVRMDAIRVEDRTQCLSCPLATI